VKLPNLENAVVSERKVVAYLLDPKHPDGAAKAAFFNALGFHAGQWSILADALKQVAAENEVAQTMQTVHGQKYVVEGLISTPIGRDAMVRTVWIVDAGQTTPRLVTAYPLAEDNEND
jgi:hypothetical protein